VISEYAESLAAQLGFDWALSRRVRQEVEDHLRDAVAAAGGGREAEQRAIARFGDPRAIAAQFARGSLARQARSTGMTVLLVLVAILLAMQARIAWYGLTQWPACARLEATSDAITLVDRIAFCCAVLAAFTAWVCRRRLPIFFAGGALATGAALVSVACDGALTALRLSGWEYSADFLVPLASMGIEIACAAALALHIRSAVRRAAAANALAKLDRSGLKEREQAA
jgi:hypothetical protein